MALGGITSEANTEKQRAKTLVEEAAAKLSNATGRDSSRVAISNASRDRYAVRERMSVR